MSRAAKQRASRLRRFTDKDDEYRETGSPEAAIERARAMRESTPSDFGHATERLHGRTVDDQRRREANCRRLGISFGKMER